MELLSRKLWLPHWTAFGKAGPTPNTDGLVAGSAIHSNADQG